MRQSLQIQNSDNGNKWITQYVENRLGISGLPLDLTTVSIEESDLQLPVDNLMELYSTAVQNFKTDNTNPQNLYELVHVCAIMQQLNLNDDFRPLMLTPIREFMIPDLQRLSNLILDNLKEGDYPTDKNVKTYVFYRRQILAMYHWDEARIQGDVLYDYYRQVMENPLIATYEEEIQILEEIFSLFKNDSIPDLDFNELSQQIFNILHSGRVPDPVLIELYKRCRKFIKTGQMSGDASNDTLFVYFEDIAENGGESDTSDYLYLKRIFEG